MINLNNKLLNVVVDKIKDDNITTILEIGSRDGNDSNFLSKKFNLKNENVHIVEPNYISFNKIKENYNKFNLYNLAINSYNGVCAFNNIEDINVIGVSSIRDRIDNFYEKNDTSKVEVNCITGEKLLSSISNKIDYCQIDVEGMGYEVLESFSDSIKNIKYIFIESEHKIVWEGQKVYTDIENILNKTHKLIYTDYKEGNLQSNTMWVEKNNNVVVI